MLSPIAITIIKRLPEGLVIKIARKIVANYIKKYANITINGIE